MAGAQAGCSGSSPVVARQGIALAIAREGRKVDLAMDMATSDIRALAFTPAATATAPVLPELLDQIPEGEEIDTVTAPSRQIAANPLPGNGQGP